MFAYDPQILHVVSVPRQSVADVKAALLSIDALCMDIDGLKWFNWLYLQVTNAVETRVTAGGFHDPAWLAQLDVEFAKLYFSALRDKLSGQAPPECWQVLFDRREDRRLGRIQFALAGINAHINHDLPMAIVSTSRATGTIPSHTSQHYVDYTDLNTTLDDTIEMAKQTLHVRLPGDALPHVTFLEDALAAWCVSAARESAWQNSEHLWQLSFLASSFENMLDGLTTVIGKTLLIPVP